MTTILEPPAADNENPTPLDPRLRSARDREQDLARVMPVWPYARWDKVGDSYLQMLLNRRRNDTAAKPRRRVDRRQILVWRAGGAR